MRRKQLGVIDSVLNCRPQIIEQQADKGNLCVGKQQGKRQPIARLDLRKRCREPFGGRFDTGCRKKTKKGSVPTASRRHSMF